MRYAILGGGCAFAMHTAIELLSDPRTEVVLSFFHSQSTVLNDTVLFPAVLSNRSLTAKFAVVHGDLHQIVTLLSTIETAEPDVIINFAAEGESGASFENSWKYFDTNATASARLVETLLHAPYLKRFIQISTGEVYGSVDCPARETDLLNPTSPYAASKAAFDHYLVALHRRRGFPFNIVRPCNTYCEGQQLYRIIPKAIMLGLTGGRLPLYGNGLGMKTYMHAADLARGIHAVATAAPLGRIYNLAARMPTSTREIVLTIERLLGLPQCSLFDDVGLRRGTDAQYWFDSQRAEHELGWQPQIGLEQGLQRVIDWTKQNLDVLKDMLPAELARQPVPQPIGV